MRTPSQSDTRCFEQKIVRYWHPRLGGWYHARVLRTVEKKRELFCIVKPLAPKGSHTVNVPAEDVREVAA